MDGQSALKETPPTPAIEQVTVRVLPDGRMKRSDAARYIGVEDKTLANWGLLKKGPESVLVAGRLVATRIMPGAYRELFSPA